MLEIVIRLGTLQNYGLVPLQLVVIVLYLTVKKARKFF